MSNGRLICSSFPRYLVVIGRALYRLLDLYYRVFIIYRIVGEPCLMQLIYAVPDPGLLRYNAVLG